MFVKRSFSDKLLCAGPELRRDIAVQSRGILKCLDMPTASNSA